MNRALGRRAAEPPAPPHWAVVLVKCCVVGILLLPLATMMWVLTYRPAEGNDLGPIAFMVTAALGIAMATCATWVTRRYPPVPTAHHP
jgi:hypothetical protein